jgi:hypothetical protein
MDLGLRKHIPLTERARREFSHRILQYLQEISASPAGIPSSEKELYAQLNKARRIGVHDLPKSGASDIAVDGLGAEELCVVKNIEPLHPKLE